VLKCYISAIIIAAVILLRKLLSLDTVFVLYNAVRCGVIYTS